MDARAKRINEIIDRSRKILLTIISVVIIMIFIRGCINQIFNYQKEHEYMRKTLDTFYSNFENNSECIKHAMSSEADEKRIHQAQMQLIDLIHEFELRQASKNHDNINGTNIVHNDRYDYALDTVGGSVVSYHDTKLMYNCSVYWLLIGKCHKINPPEKAIQRLVEPGEGFCFEGNQGAITIKLACPVILDSTTIEHVDRSMTPKLDFSNAPKSISITGMSKKHDANGHEYGNFTFNPNMSKSQTFYLGPSSEKYRFLKFNVTDNYGGKETCIYRIKVHGHTDEEC